MPELSRLCVDSLPKPWPAFKEISLSFLHSSGLRCSRRIGNLSMSLLSETETVKCLYYFLTHPRLHSTAVFRVSNDIATIV